MPLSAGSASDLVHERPRQSVDYFSTCSFERFNPDTLDVPTTGPVESTVPPYIVEGSAHLTQFPFRWSALRIGGSTVHDGAGRQAGMRTLSGGVTGCPSRTPCNLSSCASVRSNARSRLAS
jgi:hypothetical protein